VLTRPLTASADDKGAPAKTTPNSITDGFRSLGQQISDPKTPGRIKGHEQEFEKNVQSTRDQQRKSHPGEVRASDAPAMANSPKMGGQGATNTATKSSTSAKPKASAAKVKKSDGAAAHDAKAPAPPATPPTK
jgi:hypothetical protein